MIACLSNNLIQGYILSLNLVSGLGFECNLSIDIWHQHLPLIMTTQVGLHFCEACSTFNHTFLPPALTFTLHRIQLSPVISCFTQILSKIGFRTNLFRYSINPLFLRLLQMGNMHKAKVIVAMLGL